MVSSRRKAGAPEDGAQAYSWPGTLGQARIPRACESWKWWFESLSLGNRSSWPPFIDEKT